MGVSTPAGTFSFTGSGSSPRDLLPIRSPEHDSRARPCLEWSVQEPRQEEPAGIGSEYIGLFHVAYVPGTRNDPKLGVGMASRNRSPTAIGLRWSASPHRSS